LAAERYLENHDLGDKAYVVPAICLDVCGQGVTLVVEPDGTWYSVETTADVETIIDQHIGRGEIVTAFQIDPPE